MNPHDRRRQQQHDAKIARDRRLEEIRAINAERREELRERFAALREDLRQQRERFRGHFGYPRPLVRVRQQRRLPK